MRELVNIQDNYFDIVPIDNNPDTWYGTDSNNIIGGYPKNKFKGEELITQKELLTLIYNII